MELLLESFHKGKHVDQVVLDSNIQSLIVAVIDCQGISSTLAMGDADILDLLFDSGSGIIGEQPTSCDRQQSNNMLFTDDQLKKPAGLMTDFDTTDWSSSVLDLVS